MNGIKRFLAVLGMALSVVVGTGVPASATFSDTTAVATTNFATVTVAAPGNVVGELLCGGRSDSTMKVSWTHSDAARISGYRVTVHFSDGYEQGERVAATATSWTKKITTYNVTKYAIQYSLTTLTDHGWYTQSSKTGWFQC